MLRVLIVASATLAQAKSTPTPPAYECTMDKDAFKELLDKKHASIEKVETSELRDDVKVEGHSITADRGLTEIVLLKSGLKLKAQIGGCDHLGNSYEFDGVDTSKVASDEGMLTLLAELLEKVPVKKGSVAEWPRDILLKTARELLKSGKVEATAGNLLVPCGDASCNYVWTKDGNGKARLTALYSFAL